MTANMASNSSTFSTPTGSASVPQYAVLDLLIPGFSVFTTAVQTYVGIDLTIYFPFILLICGTIWSSEYITSQCWSFASKHFMSTVQICTDDEIYNMMMGWIVQQKFSQESHHIMANTSINSKNWMLWRLREESNDEEEDEENEEERESRRWSNRRSKKALQYTPNYGTHYFWYKRHLMVLNRCDNKDQMSNLLASEKEELHITCWGRNPQILKDLLLDARELYIKRDESKTLIYRGTAGANLQEPSWQRCMARSTRPFSTVILNEAKKKSLIDDVADYLEPSTRRWYANRGIPYRRGYLLYGPPGTGKSSLSLALAGHFNMRIYILSLSSPMATEENVATLFASLPRRCVVLLEDIDSAGLTHTRDDKASEGDAAPPSAAAPTPTPVGAAKSVEPVLPIGRLSLSGLLNILDGVASQEGRLLIMTTNHLEKLDKALIRPGRVDMSVEFGKADGEMSASIFHAIYSPYDGEGTPSYSSTKSDGPEQRQFVVEELNGLAKDFAAKIPELEFSPAEIQGLLLRHKHDPRAAIADADKWVVQTRQEKEEKELQEAEDRRKKLEKQQAEEAEKKAKEAKEKQKAEKRKAAKKTKGNVQATSDSESDAEKVEHDEVEEGKENDTNTTEKKKQSGTSDSGYGTP